MKAKDPRKENKIRARIKKIHWPVVSLKDLLLLGLVVAFAVFSIFVIRPVLDAYFFQRAIGHTDFMAQSQEQIGKLLDIYKPIRNWVVEEPEITARSALAMEIYPDGRAKGLFSKNVNHPYSIASITKLMSAMVAVDQYDLDHQIRISFHSAGQIGRTGIMREGDLLSVKDLIHLSLMESNNAAAHALAESRGVGDFVRLMNQKAASLGLSETSFVTPSGLSAINGAENYSTAGELAEMVLHLWTQPEYEIIRQALRKDSHPIYDGTGAFYHRVYNNNQLLDRYDSLVGGKTGYLPTAGECLVSVFQRKEEDVYLVVVVLGSRDRFGDTEQIVSWIPQAYLFSFDYDF